MSASHGNTTSSFIGWFLLALANAAVTGVALVYGLAVSGLRCDESCSAAPGWSHHYNAWQWDAALALEFVGFAAAVAVLLVFIAGPAKLLWFSLSVQGIAFFLWLLLIATA